MRHIAQLKMTRDITGRCSSANGIYDALFVVIKNNASYDGMISHRTNLQASYYNDALYHTMLEGSKIYRGRGQKAFLAKILLS